MLILVADWSGRTTRMKWGKVVGSRVFFGERRKLCEGVCERNTGRPVRFSHDNSAGEVIYIESSFGSFGFMESNGMVMSSCS